MESASSPPKCSKTVIEDCNAVERTAVPSPPTPSCLITQLRLSAPCSSTVTCTQKHLAPKQLFMSGM